MRNRKTILNKFILFKARVISFNLAKEKQEAFDRTLAFTMSQDFAGPSAPNTPTKLHLAFEFQPEGVSEVGFDEDDAETTPVYLGGEHSQLQPITAKEPHVYRSALRLNKNEQIAAVKKLRSPRQRLKKFRVKKTERVAGSGTFNPRDLEVILSGRAALDKVSHGFYKELMDQHYKKDFQIFCDLVEAHINPQFGEISPSPSESAVGPEVRLKVQTLKKLESYVRSSYKSSTRPTDFKVNRAATVCRAILMDDLRHFAIDSLLEVYRFAAKNRCEDLTRKVEAALSSYTRGAVYERFFLPIISNLEQPDEIVPEGKVIELMNAIIKKPGFVEFIIAKVKRGEAGPIKDQIKQALDFYQVEKNKEQEKAKIKGFMEIVCSTFLPYCTRNVFKEAVEHCKALLVRHASDLERPPLSESFMLFCRTVYKNLTVSGQPLKAAFAQFLLHGSPESVTRVSAINDLLPNLILSKRIQMAKLFKFIKACNTFLKEEDNPINRAFIRHLKQLTSEKVMAVVVKQARKLDDKKRPQIKKLCVRLFSEIEFPGLYKKLLSILLARYQDFTQGILKEKIKPDELYQVFMKNKDQDWGAQLLPAVEFVKVMSASSLDPRKMIDNFDKGLLNIIRLSMEKPELKTIVPLLAQKAKEYFKCMAPQLHVAMKKNPVKEHFLKMKNLLINGLKNKNQAALIILTEMLKPSASSGSAELSSLLQKLRCLAPVEDDILALTGLLSEGVKVRGPMDTGVNKELLEVIELASAFRLMNYLLEGQLTDQTNAELTFKALKDWFISHKDVLNDKTHPVSHYFDHYVRVFEQNRAAIGFLPVVLQHIQGEKAELPLVLDILLGTNYYSVNFEKMFTTFQEGMEFLTGSQHDPVNQRLIGQILVRNLVLALKEKIRIESVLYPAIIQLEKLQQFRQALDKYRKVTGCTPAEYYGILFLVVTKINEINEAKLRTEKLTAQQEGEGEVVTGLRAFGKRKPKPVKTVLELEFEILNNKLKEILKRVKVHRRENVRRSNLIQARKFLRTPNLIDKLIKPQEFIALQSIIKGNAEAEALCKCMVAIACQHSADQVEMPEPKKRSSGELHSTVHTSVKPKYERSLQRMEEFSELKIKLYMIQAMNLEEVQQGYFCIRPDEIFSVRKFLVETAMRDSTLLQKHVQLATRFRKEVAAYEAAQEAGSPDFAMMMTALVELFKFNSIALFRAETRRMLNDHAVKPFIINQLYNLVLQVPGVANPMAIIYALDMVNWGFEAQQVHERIDLRQTVLKQLVVQCSKYSKMVPLRWDSEELDPVAAVKKIRERLHLSAEVGQKVVPSDLVQRVSGDAFSREVSDFPVLVQVAKEWEAQYQSDPALVALVAAMELSGHIKPPVDIMLAGRIKIMVNEWLMGKPEAERDNEDMLSVLRLFLKMASNEEESIEFFEVATEYLIGEFTRLKNPDIVTALRSGILLISGRLKSILFRKSANDAYARMKARRAAKKAVEVADGEAVVADPDADRACKHLTEQGENNIYLVSPSHLFAGVAIPAQYAYAASLFMERQLLVAGSEQIILKARHGGYKRGSELGYHEQIKASEDENVLCLCVSGHPNIAVTQDFWADRLDLARDIFVTMKFYAKGDLDKVLKESVSSLTTITLLQKIKWMIDIAEGLKHVHSKGYVHLDLKPDNVLIGAGKDQTAALADFGMMRRAGSSGFTLVGLTGTSSYFSPEYIKTKIATKSNDVFAFGVICYQILNPKIATRKFVNVHSFSNMDRFTKRSMSECKQLCLTEEVLPRDGSIPVRVTALVRDVMSRFIAKDPKDRISLDEALKKLKQAKTLLESPPAGDKDA